MTSCFFSRYCQRLHPIKCQGISSMVTYIWPVSIVNCKQLELINLASLPIICRSFRFPFPDSVSLQAFYTPPDAVVTLVAFSQAQPRYPMARQDSPPTHNWLIRSDVIYLPTMVKYAFFCAYMLGGAFLHQPCPADHPTFFSMQPPSISFKLYTSKPE